MDLPYWLSWLIYVGGMIATFCFGYAIGFSRGADKEFNRQREELDELYEASEMRERELQHWINDAAEHIKTCPKVNGKVVLNPVTGRPLGYVREDTSD